MTVLFFTQAANKKSVYFLRSKYMQIYFLKVFSGYVEDDVEKMNFMLQFFHISFDYCKEQYLFNLKKFNIH